MTLVRLGSTIINLDNVDCIEINPNGSVCFTFYYEKDSQYDNTLIVGADDAADFLAQIDGITLTPAGLARFETTKYKRIV